MDRDLRFAAPTTDRSIKQGCQRLLNEGCREKWTKCFALAEKQSMRLIRMLCFG